jgi:hypothetical protein
MSKCKQQDFGRHRMVSARFAAPSPHSWRFLRFSWSQPSFYVTAMRRARCGHLAPSVLVKCCANIHSCHDVIVCNLLRAAGLLTDVASNNFLATNIAQPNYSSFELSRYIPSNSAKPPGSRLADRRQHLLRELDAAADPFLSYRPAIGSYAQHAPVGERRRLSPRTCPRCRCRFRSPQPDRFLPRLMTAGGGGQRTPPAFSLNYPGVFWTRAAWGSGRKVVCGTGHREVDIAVQRDRPTHSLSHTHRPSPLRFMNRDYAWGFA